MLAIALPILLVGVLVFIAVQAGQSTPGADSTAPGVRVMHTIYAVVVSLLVLTVAFCYLWGRAQGMVG